MDRYERKDLKSDIRTSKLDNLDHLLDFLVLWMQALIGSACIFGPTSKATKETIKLIKEYIKIHSRENDLYYYLYKHSKYADNETVGEFIENIFTLGENTFKYYMDYLDEILVACDLRQEHRVIRDKKKFNTLIESNEFFSKLLEIVIDEEAIIAYLGIPVSFRNFLDEDNLRVCYVDYRDNNEREFIGVIPKLDENNRLKDFRLFVPTIIDLNTAKIYAYIVFAAYLLYLQKEDEITDELLDEIDQLSRNKVSEYVEYYKENEKKLLPKE